MFDIGNYWSNPVVEVTTDLLPDKRGDPGRPVIPISIGMVDFPEALCDFGSSINVAPSFDNKTKYSNMCAQDVQTHILSQIVNISK